ncbi:MAG: VanZ family protein, partial [Eubacterium sp.]|nr:VanZ family protein [Eubacterium sp.]
SCFTVTTNRITGYFSYTTTDRLIFKFVIVFLFVIATVLLNKNQLNYTINYSSVFINVLLVIFVFDYFVTNFSGTNSYYRMWWLCIIHIANAGLYIGLSLCCKYDFKKLAKKLLLSFLPTYIFTFLLIFARKPNSYFEVNLKLGEGLISSLDYLISHFHGNTWPLFNFVGNIAFFIPIPFFIKAVFPKIKIYQIFFAGLLVPFFVEGYQFIFKCGSVDIDDIVFNVSGFLVGFIALLIENKIHFKKA